MTIVNSLLTLISLVIFASPAEYPHLMEEKHILQPVDTGRQRHFYLVQLLR